MAVTRTIQKQLAGKEDLLLGQGTVTQSRGGSNLPISKINAGTIPYSGDSATSDLLDLKTAMNVNGLTAMRGLSIPSGSELVRLAYHTTAGDGGGGVFRAVTGTAAGTYTDNNGTIIVPTGGNGSAAWLREYSGAVNVKWFGAKGDGATDDTAAINAAILAAYLDRPTLLSLDEVWGNTIDFCANADIKIKGSILIPSGITLRGNGCRLLGIDSTAGTAVYNPAGQVLIQSAYYSSGDIVSNAGSVLTVNRVVNASITDMTLSFANCGIDLTNTNEKSLISNVSFSGTAKAISLTACFYLSVRNVIIRNSASVTNAPAIHFTGSGNNNANLLESVYIVDAGIGVKVEGGANFTLAFLSCSFEGGYTALSSKGILLGASCYLSGFTVQGCYFENVREGLSLEVGAGVYGASITTNIFNSTEYAVRVLSTSGLRVARIEGNSLPDGGGTIRNIVDLSPNGVDCSFQRPAISGSTAQGIVTPLSNVVLGNGTYETSHYRWETASGDLSAISLNGSKNQLQPFAFTGRSIQSLTNQVPFCTLSRSGDSLVITTQIIYDDLNILVFAYSGNSSNITWNIRGFIFGTTVHYIYQSHTDLTMVINTTSGTPVDGETVKLIISKGGTGFGAVINTRGMVRHA